MAEIKKVYKNGTAYDVLNSDTVGSALTAGTGIGISSNTISNTGVTSVNGSTGAVTVQETLVSGTNIKTVNGSSLLGSGDLSVGGITKIFTLSSTRDLTNAQAAFDRFLNGGISIIKVGSSNRLYYSGDYASTKMWFNVVRNVAEVNQPGFTNEYRYSNANLEFTLSGNTVTSVAYVYAQVRVTNVVPSSGTSNSTITLVI